MVDLSAEQAVLGSIFYDSSIADDVIGVLDANAFYSSENRAIFTAMEELYSNKISIDEITVSDVLTKRGVFQAIGGMVYVGALVDYSPDTNNISDYIKIVAENYALRLLDSVKSSKTNNKNAGEAIDETISELTKISDSLHVEDDLCDIKEILYDVVADLEKRSTDGAAPVGYQTGFTDFDKITLGLHDTDFVILAARPSMGKTTLALNMATYIASHNEGDVLIFSYEMSKEQLVLKMASSMAKVDSNALKSGNLSQSEWDKLAVAADEIHNLSIKINDSNPPLDRLVSIIKKHAKKNKIKKVVIDYLQLIPTKGKNNRQEEVSMISRTMKNIAKTARCNIFALSQLNRKLEERSDKRPVMSDLRECLAVESTFLFTSKGVQSNLDSHMKLSSLNENGTIKMESSTNIPKKEAATVIVRSRSGRQIQCTPNHLLLTDTGWIKAGELTDKMSLAGANKIDNLEAKTYIKEARLIGWMIGNGSMIGYSSPSFICSDEKLADEFCKTIKNFFGLTPRVHRHKCKNIFQYDVTNGPVRTKEGNVFKNWLKSKDLWGRTAIHKEIPEWFLETADEQSIAELVAGLIDTDGTVPQFKCTKKYPNIQYSTSSLKLAHQFMYCLTRIGVYSSVDKGGMNPKFNKHLNYNVIIVDPEQLHNFKKVVTLIGLKGEKLDHINPEKRVSNFGNRVGTWVGRDLVKLARLNGISQSSLGYRDQQKRISQKFLDFYLSKIEKISKIEEGVEIKNKLSALVNDSIYWDQVDTVTDGGIAELFDRNVPVNHNFVANGLVVHNSGALEQDSDIIIFIYRDEVYNENSSDKGTAELIIAKHRNGETGTVKLAFQGKYTKFANLTTKYDFK